MVFLISVVFDIVDSAEGINEQPISAINDEYFDPENPDYCNVLPAIWDYFERNKYRP